MTDNDNESERRSFRPRRKMDRLLILLFFVDFTISIVLCVLVGHLVNVIETVIVQNQRLEQIACDNNAILSDSLSLPCQQPSSDIKE